MTYLKYLLALLFSLLQLNLFSQTYYIYVKYDVQAEYTPEITLFWSDKSETTCANTNDLHKITGLYEKHIVKLQIGNVLEIDLTKNTNMTKEQSYSYEVNDFAIKLQYDTKWSFDLFQTPITPKIDAAYKENNYYCVDDTLEFEVTNLSDTMYTSPLEIQLTQNNDIIYSGQSNTPRFKIAYGKLHVTNYPLKNVKIEIKITGKSGKPIVANSDNVTQIWKYVEVGDSDLYVIDNSLHYPKLTDDKTIVLTNIINAHYDTISDTIYNLSRNYGVYQMEIDQAEHCQITKTFVYPQITYNYINDSVNFWYSDDKRNAVDLKCYSFENTPNFAINYSDYTISKNETDSILVQDTNGQCEKKVPCHSITYHLNCTESLKAINISGNKDFIPVTQNILLKSYPKINVDTLKITPPTCYKDSVKITLDKISGGMGKDYSCVLSRSDNNNAKKIVALNNDTLIVPRSYFENTISPVIITVYDKDTILDDCGFEKRAFTTKPITLDFPDTIKITEIINKNLDCHHDFSGRIEIKSYEPKNQDYTFLIFNDTVSIYNFKADSLAAGKYKLKLSDKNNCESDTYLDSISEPLELKITDLQITDAKCFDSDDGEISYKISGGTPDYSYLWSNGAKTKDLEKVPAGKYHLKITDANNCELVLDTAVNRPKELTNSLSGDYKLCKNSSLTFDANVFEKYLWLDENGIVLSENRFQKIDNAGIFTVTVYDDKDCYTTDTLNITISEEVLDNNFLVASESFLGDTIVLINDTESRNGKISFQVPQELENLGITDTFYNYIIASVPGNYTLVTSIEGKDCTANQYREIKILDYPRPENYDSLMTANATQFVSVKFGPNPNDGNFNLNIVLTENCGLDFYLFSITDSKIIEKEKMYGKNFYSICYNKNLQDGLYFIMLKTKTENKVIKFIVSK